MRRRAALVLLGAALLAGCGAASDPDEAVLNVGSQKGGTKAVMLASGALDGAAYRVSWSEFPAAQHLLEAIGSGAVDVGLTGDAPFQFAYQSGSPIRAIGATTAASRPAEALAIVVPHSSPVRRLADLRGKSIATTRGSAGHYLVLRALERERLPADTVKLVFLAPGDAKAAFSSGAIDAWATWTPYLSAALKERARIVVDTRSFPRSYGFEVASDKAIAGKQALLADFLRREAAALRWARDHKPEFAAVLARETGLPLDIATDMVVKNDRIAVPLDTAVIDAQREVAATFVRAGALEGRRDIAAAYDQSFGDFLAAR